MSFRPTRALPLLLLAGCAADAPTPSTDPVITTEDGVTIVTNAGLDVADGGAWEVEAHPSVSIGVADGPEDYMIGQLAGMLRLEDGSILIGDAFAQNLRVFDSAGTFVRSVGRPGEGPGEFGRISNVLRTAGDSIVVLDGEGSRAHVLDADLRFVRRFHPRLSATRAAEGWTSHTLVDFFDDGSILMSDYFESCGAERLTGFCEDSIGLFRTDEAGETLAKFGDFVNSRTETRRVARGFGVSWGEPHPQPYWAVHDSRLYYGDSRRFEVRVYTMGGQLVRVIRVVAAPPEYDRDEVLGSRPWPESSDPQRQEARRVYMEARADAEVPDTLPSFSGLLVDEPGNIWLREYDPRSGVEDSSRWYVFDPEGRLRHAVRMPGSILMGSPIRPYLHPRIGDDYVLAATRDEDGVESVVLYTLHKR